MAKKKNSVVFVDGELTDFVNSFDKKISDFSGKGGAIERTINRIVPFLEFEYLTVVSTFKNPTGVTQDSLMTKPEIKWSGDDKVTAKYGFKVSKGGLAAIFINYGRPGIQYKNGTVSKPMKPTYFIENTNRKYNGTFNKIFKEEVLKELGGLTK